MTQTLTTEAMQEIYEAAVHVEATLGDPDAEFDLYCKLDDVGGVEATIRKLIDMVRAANRDAQPVASREHFESLCNQFWNWAEFDEINAGEEEPRLQWDGQNYTHRVTAALWRMYQAAPPAPAVPDIGSTAVNDAAWKLHDTLTEHGSLNGRQFNNLKGCLYEALKIVMNAPPAPVVNPEFTGATAVTIPDKVSCEGFDPKDWVEARNLGQCEGWNAYRAELLAQPVSSSYKLPEGFKLMPIEMTDEIGEAIAMEARCCGGIALCIYESALAAAPEGGNG